MLPIISEGATECTITGKSTASPLVQLLVSTTLTFPFSVPTSPQSTVIEFVPSPDAIVPPDIVQLYVLGGLSVTE